MSILLIGALGGVNYGDELILKNWLHLLDAESPASLHNYTDTAIDRPRIFVDGYNLDNVAKFATAIPEDCSLWRLLTIIETHPIDRDKQKYIDILSHILHSDRCIDGLLTSINFLQQNDIQHIHFIGGGYLNSSIWSKNVLLLFIAVILSKSLHLRLTLSGQGLVPLDNEDSNLFSALLKYVDLIDIRDKFSYEKIKSLVQDNITYTGDDLLLTLFDNTPITKSERPNPELVICIQNDLYPGQQCIQALAPLIKVILQKQEINHIHFIQAMAEDIHDFPDTLKQDLNDVHISITVTTPFDLIEKGLPYHPDSIYITTRYHIHYLAAFYGMRGLALVSGQYYQAKHDEIIRMGSTWSIVNIKNLNSQITERLDNIFKSLQHTQTRFNTRLISNLTEFATRKQVVYSSIFSASQDSNTVLVEKLLFDLLLRIGRRSLHTTIAQLEKEKLLLEATTKAILHSRSWRLTLPLRVTGKWLRTLFR